MKNWIIASAIVVITGLTVLFIATAPTDEELIREALDESIQASREGKPNPVLDNLASSFTWNGQTVGLDRGEIAQFVRLSKPEIELGQYKTEINGDEAVIVTDVQVKIEIQTLKYDRVEIRLRRDTGTRWLVFPSARWKIYEVSAPDLPSISGLGY